MLLDAIHGKYPEQSDAIRMPLKFLCVIISLSTAFRCFSKGPGILIEAFFRIFEQLGIAACVGGIPCGAHDKKNVVYSKRVNESELFFIYFF